MMILSEFPDQYCNEFPSQKRSKSIKDTMISLDKTFTARNSPLIVVVKHIGHRAVHGKIVATGRLLGRRALSSRISLCEQRTKRRPRKGIEWTEQPQFDLNMKPLQELSEFYTLALSRRGLRFNLGAYLIRANIASFYRNRRDYLNLYALKELEVY
ncbi:uncharacterized protein NECHADRAFT_89348 [Fusarium vanettenii 77-13-4]|uniref:Uncharacterized protein n=1 Tax=Fusarium vanettenii (strain ATCC MYA-4622 / CBS 123669 / FGSC 9596 / NRRL 45880 / 77-13-4) TaxID=660122 RepID=C7ZQY1_FUSV7|nr:uncharacterized protein NECHADRAFT_89348 [Fusarium vanettenii 77-13-4]EEU33568.1 predicted protein [Fusarium vanettenii 77-13-4]